jgi:uncharacterized protein YhdP
MRLIKKTLFFILYLAVVTLMVFNLGYFVFNHLANKNKILSAFATQLLKQPIEIKQTELKEFSLEPVVVFKDVRLPMAYLGELEIKINLWQSLAQKRWVTRMIAVDDLHLLTSSREKTNALTNILSWCAQQPKIIFSQHSLKWQGVNDVSMTLRELHVLIKNQGENHVISATVKAGKTQSTQFHMFTSFSAHQEKNGWRLSLNPLKIYNSNLNIFIKMHAEYHPRQRPNIIFSGSGSIDHDQFRDIQGKIEDATSLSTLELKLGEFYFLNQSWKNVLLDVTQNKSDFLIHVQNSAVFGNVAIPKNWKSPLRAHFRYLFLTSDRHSASEITQEINPRDIPPLIISADNLRVNRRVDGRVFLATHPIREGLSIRQLTMNSPLLAFSAKGYWIFAHAQSQTALSGNVSSNNIGEWLQQRRLSVRLKGGVLSSTFSLQWPASPQQFSPVHATGKVDFKVEKGRILKLDSDTESNLDISRLLNLVSLESLSHVLRFDKQSIVKKGFPFDYLQGQVFLKQGVLSTNDVEMNGSLAKVNFSGKVGLMDQANKLHMTVFPKVSSSAMTLIGMTGGPVTGAATWLANKLVSPVMGHLMQINYQVTGTLSHPTIKRVN